MQANQGYNRFIKRRGEDKSVRRRRAGLLPVRGTWRPCRTTIKYFYELAHKDAFVCVCVCVSICLRECVCACASVWGGVVCVCVCV